jgi:Zn-dependent protease
VIQLLTNGRIALFLIILFALMLSLTLHEFGHALVAKLYGDDTAQRAGRLTLNPIPHIHPAGLLMVILLGFGFAKPVPTDPRNYSSRWGVLVVSAAGPAMNLLLAVVTVNFYLLGTKWGFEALSEPGPRFFFLYLAQINLLLMVFNLVPLGALDGHYILPYFLPGPLALRYRYYNARYGNYVLLGLIILSLMGLPILHYVFSLSQRLLPLIEFV